MESDQGQAAAQLPFEAAKDATDDKRKAENNSSIMVTVKSSGKNSKDSGEAPKEDYIHVRARRGQATNSHSLAERVTLSSISEASFASLEPQKNRKKLAFYALASSLCR